MNFPISRAQLQNITKDYERIHRQNCINSAVEHIKKLIIEKAYMDSHIKTAGLIPRIVNTSDTLYNLKIALPLNFPMFPSEMTNHYYSSEKSSELLEDIITELKVLFTDIEFRVDSQTNCLVVDWY